MSKRQFTNLIETSMVFRASQFTGFFLTRALVVIRIRIIDCFNLGPSPDKVILPKENLPTKFFTQQFTIPQKILKFLHRHLGVL